LLASKKAMNLKIKTPLLLSLAFALFSLTASAQFVDIPTVVKDSFDKKFPEAKQVEWLHNFGKPEVKFKMSDKNCWARFTSKGVWEVTETKITEAELPVEVTDGLHKSKYNEWPIKEVSKYDRPGGVTYKINVSKGTLNSKSLYFNEKGQLQKDDFKI